MFKFFNFLRLVNVVAPLMNKPVPAFNWVLDTDKAMSKVVFIDLLSTEKFVVEKIPDVEK